jgi:hypothetical protein
MPKLRPETARARASKIIKDYSEAGFNQSRLAEKKGVSQANISQCLNRLPVKKTLQDIINENLKKAGTTLRKVYRINDEQLSATRTISAVISPDGKQKDANGQSCDFVEVPDWIARDKALDRTFVLMGHIKHTNGNGKGGVSAIIINIRNQSGLLCETQAETVSPVGK